MPYPSSFLALFDVPLFVSIESLALLIVSPLPVHLAMTVLLPYPSSFLAQFVVPLSVSVESVTSLIVSSPSVLPAMPVLLSYSSSSCSSRSVISFIFRRLAHLVSAMLGHQCLFLPCLDLFFQKRLSSCSTRLYFLPVLRILTYFDI